MIRSYKSEYPLLGTAFAFNRFDQFIKVFEMRIRKEHSCQSAPDILHCIIEHPDKTPPRIYPYLYTWLQCHQPTVILHSFMTLGNRRAVEMTRYIDFFTSVVDLRTQNHISPHIIVPFYEPVFLMFLQSDSMQQVIPSLTLDHAFRCAVYTWYMGSDHTVNADATAGLCAFIDRHIYDYMCLSKQRRRVPFASRLLVHPFVLKVWASRYKFMTTDQRRFFQRVCWNIGPVSSTRTLGTPSPMGNMVLSFIDEWWHHAPHSSIAPTEANQVFWTRLGDIVDFTTHHRAMRLLVYRESEYNAMSSVCMIVRAGLGHLLKPLLRIIQNVGLVCKVMPPRKIRRFAVELRSLLISEVPPVLKRIAWQNLLELSPTSTTEPVNELKLTDYPCFNTEVTPAQPIIGHYDGDPIDITLDRYSCILSQQSLLIMSWAPLSLLRLRVRDEEADGVAVYYEALQIVTTNLHKWFFLDDTGAWELKADLPLDMIPYLFSTGSILGLCLLRGLYLPFRLSSGVWTNVMRQGVDLYEGYRDRCRLLRASGCSDDQIVNYLPTPESLGALVYGMRSMLQYHDFNVAECDAMFSCEDTLHKRTRAEIITRFKAAISVENRRDYEFLGYIDTLSRDQVLTLIKFIMGKPRLPLPNEEPIRLNWSTGQTLMAHNCVHSLTLPAVDFPLALARIFEWEVVFGAP